MSCTYLNIYTHNILKLPEVDAAFQNDWRCALKYFTDKGHVSLFSLLLTLRLFCVGIKVLSFGLWGQLFRFGTQV